MHFADDDTCGTDYADEDTGSKSKDEDTTLKDEDTTLKDEDTTSKDTDCNEQAHPWEE